MSIRTTALLTLLAACGESTGTDDKDAPSSTQATGDTATTETTPDTATPPTDTATSPPATGDPAVLQLAPPDTVDNGRFATSQICATCHDGDTSSGTMIDEDGRNIAPFDLWQSSMMANAGRDPLWRAFMSAEIAGTPAAADAIGQKCTRCHAPMASGDAELMGEALPTSDVLTDGSERMLLALDGVSCAACHQIEDVDLGSEASFSGGWTILGQGRMYGPHANPFDHPMSMNGFTPLQSPHMRESELCATCHTLTTHALDETGQETGGTVLEQGPYLEWRNSDYATTASCQGCHLPTTSEDGVPISTELAHNPFGMAFPPAQARSPYGRHTLVGGNTLIPAILRDWAAVLNPLAPAAAFDATIDEARTQLEERTGTVSIDGASVSGDTLSFAARVVSLTGHKLPTGIPLRRVWLHTRVTDTAGAVVFESGAWDTAGRLVDEQGDPLASEDAGGPIADHFDSVTSPAEVPVYEAIMADGAGDPTFLLLRGEGWVKDNRLLPAGWDPAVATIDATAAVGVGSDPDFGGGGDTVHYTIDVASAAGPLTVEVGVMYQTLSARWAAELFASGTPEALGFQVMYEAAERGPETIATDSEVVVVD